MLNAIKRALAFMTAQERVRFYLFLSFRAFVALLDLVGILAIGFLATSIAFFFTQGSDPTRIVKIAEIELPAVTAQSLPLIAVIILTLFVSKAVASIFLTGNLANFLAQIEARSARSIAKAAFGRGLSAGSKQSREEVQFAVQEGSPNTFNNLLNATGSIVAEGFLFLLVLATFAFVNPIASIVAIAYFGLVGLLMSKFIGTQMERTGKKLVEGAVQANTAIGDLAEIIREATVSGKTQEVLSRIEEARKKAAKNNAKQYVLMGMPRYVIETALIVAIAIFILLQSLSGDIVSSAATIGVFIAGGLRLTASLLPLQSALLQVRQALPIAKRALEILEEEGGTSVLGEVQGLESMSSEVSSAVSVSAKDVSFAYRNSPSLAVKNISFEVKPGSQVAFIGPSGSGKSTMADIILGLLLPSSGQILVDNKAPVELINSQPGLFGYVPQRPGMITGTIAQNIAVSLREDLIEESRLNKAISDSNLRQLIDSLPNGVNTDLGKQKNSLSGGQLQRIGLARALYTQPKLLVMDEATSALDAESESKINTALNKLRGEVTVILIAHRLNTVQRSDVVFLMEEGQITDSGTFPELLKKNSTLQNLAQLMAIDNSHEGIDQESKNRPSG